jgi:hypothetical protein
MAFSEFYLMRCFDEGPRWAGKETALGDWYVHLKSGVDVVSTKGLHTVRFSELDSVMRQIKAGG